MTTQSLLVTLIPRGRSVGASAIAALRTDTLELTGLRVLPEEHYLGAPAGALLIEHSRGICQVEDKLGVGAFNGVRLYDVQDAAVLQVSPGPLLTHPWAVDVHGVKQVKGNLVAACTGTDAVLEWDVNSGAAHGIPLLAPPAEDLRFAPHAARDAGCRDWRDILPGRLHINDASRRCDGSLLISSLTGIYRMTDAGPVRLLHRLGGSMHDLCLSDDDDTITLTDAARGQLLRLGPDGRIRGQLKVADPSLWFVRGLAETKGVIFVLKSQLLESHQRGQACAREPTSDQPRGECGKFGVTVVDRTNLKIVATRALSDCRLAPGSVAYGAVVWRQT